MLANSNAGPRGRLFNPTAFANGWAPHLAAPNPTSRDELLSFTSELEFPFRFLTPVTFFIYVFITVQQCILSATDLGLPLLPQNTPVIERRRQIALKIGVVID